MAKYKGVGKRSPHSLLVGIFTSSHCADSIEASQEAANRSTAGLLYQPLLGVFSKTPYLTRGAARLFNAALFIIARKGISLDTHQQMN